jgi:hypothetical protein
MSDVNWARVVEDLRALESLQTVGSEVALSLQHAAFVIDMRARSRPSEEPTPVAACVRVCVESPFRGASEAEYVRNMCYADAALLDCLERDEAPFLGHLLYPRVLDDRIAADRERGINAHMAWLRGSARVAAYIDLGISEGMQQAIDLAGHIGVPVVERSIPKWREWMQRLARPTPGFPEKG